MNCILRHSRNGKVYHQCDISELFRDAVNATLIVNSDTEEDYLHAMSLMYGKEQKVARKVANPKNDHLHVSIPDLEPRRKEWMCGSA